MATQANIVQEGVDRVREAVSSIETDLDKVQKRAEKEIRSRRKRFEKTTEKQVKRLQTRFSKNPFVKRAQSAYDDAAKQLEKNVDSFLGAINIASSRDIRRVDRKLNQIAKKLRELESVSAASPKAKAS
jgi:cell fate (sporulation/competence/biofilm development) regulator YmcA (YheA/YmcA/DUF963 family)